YTVITGIGISCVRPRDDLFGYPLFPLRCGNVRTHTCREVKPISRLIGQFKIAEEAVDYGLRSIFLQNVPRVVGVLGKIPVQVVEGIVNVFKFQDRDITRNLQQAAVYGRTLSGGYKAII